MKKKDKLKEAERLEIAILLQKQYSYRDIAKVLKRSPNTISYEVKNNSVNGQYDPLKAEKKAHLRKRLSKLQWKKIEENQDLRSYVICKLKKHWNPDEISGKMKAEKKSFYVSKSTIYAWLRSNRGQYYCQYLYSKRYEKKKRSKKKTDRVMIPDRTSLDKRFLGANHRTRYGHFEKDALVSGKKGTGSLAVIQERRSRYLMIKKTQTMTPREHSEATQKMIKNLKVKSITFDNGIENKKHKDLKIPTFFCDPYSSWQKGGIENVNKMIRRYLPKGTNLSKVSVKKIKKITNLINQKPRKILGYRSALEVALEHGVLLKDET